MVKYNKVNVKLSDAQLKKKTENSCQKENRNNSENESKNT